MVVDRAAVARRMLAAAAAVLVALPVAGARATEPADDHMGGADVAFLRPITGAIDHAGDHDWYAIDVALDSGQFVEVTRTGGACGPDALHATLLNPEGRAISWHVLHPGEKVTLAMPSLTPGRYFVEVDAGGEPACASATYTITMGQLAFTGGGVHTDLKGAGCAAARAQVNTDRIMAARFRAQARTKHGATRRRYQGYGRAWAALLRKDTKIARQLCTRKR